VGIQTTEFICSCRRYIVALEKAIAYFGLPGEENMAQEDVGKLVEENFEFDAMLDRLYPPIETGPTSFDILNLYK